MRKRILVAASALALTAGTIFAVSADGGEKTIARASTEQCPPECCNGNSEGCGPNSCEKGGEACCDPEL
jgi:hypothetical protein